MSKKPRLKWGGNLQAYKESVEAFKKIKPKKVNKKKLKRQPAFTLK